MMYQFSKVRHDDGSWRLELDGINLIIDGFFLKRGKHYLKNPEKAIAFFNFKGNLYGVSNQLKTYTTAEDFYETMRDQYAYFKPQSDISSGMMNANKNQSSMRQAS